MRLRGIALIVLVASLGLGAVACGGDGGGDGASAEPTTTAESEAGGGGEGATVQLAADPEGGLAFDKDSLSASAGKITIEFTNDASIPHNVSVEGQTSDTIMGDSTTLELDLEAGEYEFICAVPGHAEGGMRGTLTVE
jgi:plastocyanin